jgi:hypothetical protein
MIATLCNSGPQLWRTACRVTFRATLPTGRRCATASAPQLRAVRCRSVEGRAADVACGGSRDPKVSGADLTDRDAPPSPARPLSLSLFFLRSSSGDHGHRRHSSPSPSPAPCISISAIAAGDGREALGAPRADTRPPTRTSTLRSFWHS